MQKNKLPNLIKMRQEVEDRFERDFNFISLHLLEKAYTIEDLLESVIYPDNAISENDEALYPMWNTLFEAKDNFLSDKLKYNVNELAKIGIYLMQVEETQAMMFICGAGYDFYHFHWISLYRDVFKCL